MILDSANMYGMQSTHTSVPAVAAASSFDPAAMQRQAAQAARLLKVMANAVRLQLLCQLAQGEQTVGQLNAGLPALSQSALSQHLARLRQQQLVMTRRQGAHIRYALAEGPAQAVMHTLYAIYCAPAAGTQSPGHPEKMEDA